MPSLANIAPAFSVLQRWFCCKGGSTPVNPGLIKSQRALGVFLLHTFLLTSILYLNEKLI